MFFRDDDSMPIRRASLRRNAGILDFFRKKQEEEVSPSDIKSQAAMINKMSDTLFPDIMVQVLANASPKEVDEWNMKNESSGAPHLTHVLGIFFLDPEYRHNPRKQHRYITLYMSGSIVIGMKHDYTTSDKVFRPNMWTPYRAFLKNVSYNFNENGKPLHFALKLIKQMKWMYSPY